jgi:Protein of unknown function (DUF2721)
MTAQEVAQTIQLIIAPAVLLSVCTIIQNGILSRYGLIGDQLRSLTSESLRLLEQGIGNDLEQERIQEINYEIPFFARRYKLLQDAVLTIYYAVTAFILSMFLIAISVMVKSSWVATSALLMFLGGTLILLGGVGLVFVEIRKSHQALNYEIQRVMELQKSKAQTNL